MLAKSNGFVKAPLALALVMIAARNGMRDHVLARTAITTSSKVLRYALSIRPSLEPHRVRPSTA